MRKASIKKKVKTEFYKQQRELKIVIKTGDL